jgi:2-oxoglutarate ferredoxin oxidoreductase subunit alpha
MSRVRGGTNSTSIRISSHRVQAYVDRIDILIPLDRSRTKHLARRISRETVILGEKGNMAETCLEGECRAIEVPYSEKAEAIGSKLYANVVAVGVIAGLFKLEKEIIEGHLRRYFSSKDETTIQNNLKAAAVGVEIGQSLPLKLDMAPDPAVKNEIVINGAEALGLGAIAGGCNFIAAYPMTPSTTTFTFLAQQARQFGIAAEQAEDEIAAVNMALGAWYAGARALVTTSGGGFDLMQEGLSLAGMLESPLVVNIAQRPGPATGLPTRTEQGDLNLALYCGHGEFPRLILAPGNIEEGFHLMAKAFNLADKYQLPVFVLTDQYFVDSYYNLPALALAQATVEKHFVKTTFDYRRYSITADNISPRGIPGWGDGMVAVDSDEHDTEGHITEDLELRTRMQDKRQMKLAAAKNDAIPSELVGNQDYQTLVVGWGSNYHIIKEALAQLKREDVSFLHVKQLYPLPAEVGDYLKKAKKLILIENNAGGQLGQLIKLTTGIEINDRLLKYNGLPFSVEEIQGGLEKLI